MPAQPFWMQRISEILATAKASQVPFLDRAAVENLFALRKRQAIRVMHLIGGYHIGKAFVVGRPELLTWLQKIAASPKARWSEAARERLEVSIEEARSLLDRNRKFMVSADARSRKLDGLPPTVHLRPGELRIEFFGLEDLSRQLFELGMAMANDYSRLARLVEE